MNWRVPLSDIDFGPDEAKAAQEVMRDRWLTMGAITRAFEDEFARYTGAKHAIAVANGTAGLHLAYLAAGLKPGDEVILPSLTFVATAAAVRYAGATPVFADVGGAQDLNVSPESIEERLTPRTRAVAVMHYGGYPCDMPRLRALADEHGVALIEDAAHAVGSELRGRKLGTWGDVGCFSFFSNKNLVTGEGGILVTDDDHAAERIRLMRSHGMTTLTLDRYEGHAWSYDVVELGYNYRIDEIRSAIGRVQLSKLDDNNDKRRALTRRYRELLTDIAPEVALPFRRHPGVSACHLMPILLPERVDRTAFMEHMKSQGIQTSIHYPPIHRFAYYNGMTAGCSYSLPQTEAVASREVTLPLYPTMSASQVEYVVQAVRSGLPGSR